MEKLIWFPVFGIAFIPYHVWRTDVNTKYFLHKMYLNIIYHGLCMGLFVYLTF